ncbi:MAG: hypothetical protein K1000chlam3_01387, partial [Chlamydiae bacterium]|nr:hypothetical protein [Chlamydiota bacterium]
MSGILALGKSACDATSYFSPETCALPTSQRGALLVIAGLLYVANTARKEWQSRSVQNLSDANVLQMAIHGNHKGIQRYIAKGGDLEIVDPTSGNTPLMEASKNGHFGIVR